MSVQGWLGGELVYKHHIGVFDASEGADPRRLTRVSRRSRVNEDFHNGQGLRPSCGVEA